LQLAAELGHLVQQAVAEGEVVELHEGVAHLFVGALEILDLPLQGLDGILLAVPIRPLSKADLRPAPLQPVSARASRYVSPAFVVHRGQVTCLRAWHGY
jgi:hypothetical protein